MIHIIGIVLQYDNHLIDEELTNSPFSALPASLIPPQNSRWRLGDNADLPARQYKCVWLCLYCIRFYELWSGIVNGFALGFFKSARYRFGPRMTVAMAPCLGVKTVRCPAFSRPYYRSMIKTNRTRQGTQ